MVYQDHFDWEGDLYVGCSRSVGDLGRLFPQVLRLLVPGHSSMSLTELLLPWRLWRKGFGRCSYALSSVITASAQMV